MRYELVANIADIQTGPFGSQLHKEDYVENGTPIVTVEHLGSVDRCSYVDKWHDGWMFSGRCLRIRPYDLVEPLFLYYAFCLEKTKQYIRNIAVGATMPSINTKLLGEVEVPLPPLDTQQRITKTLSAIDDKIELNQKINENLERQAQAIYESIFLDQAASCGMWNDHFTIKNLSLYHGRERSTM